MLYTCPYGRLGAVRKGIKPAELVKLDGLCLRCLKETDPDLHFFDLGRTFYLVYGGLLEETLKSPCAREVLLSLGYGKDLEVCLAALRERFAAGCPPEIGFFLGYPVKDVLGFMGIPEFTFAKTCGWKMYDPVETSEVVYRRYTKAKWKALLPKCRV